MKMLRLFEQAKVKPIHEPDLSDLNDWLVMHKPEVHAAVKHLKARHFYDVAHKVWTSSGKPDISEEILSDEDVETV